MTTTERVDPPLAASEAETLLGFLNYHRDTLRWKTEGLDEQQLNTALAPTDMTLGGMLKHLAYVEDNWFSVVLQGNEDGEYWRDVDWDADEDWDWHSATRDSAEQLRALFDDAVAASDEHIRSGLAEEGPGRLSVRKNPHTGEQFSLRWILTHMIEEYARHNGHADLIRQSIDGATGE